MISKPRTIRVLLDISKGCLWNSIFDLLGAGSFDGSGHSWYRQPCFSSVALRSAIVLRHVRLFKPQDLGEILVASPAAEFRIDESSQDSSGLNTASRLHELYADAKLLADSDDQRAIRFLATHDSPSANSFRLRIGFI